MFVPSPRPQADAWYTARVYWDRPLHRAHGPEARLNPSPSTFAPTG